MEMGMIGLGKMGAYMVERLVRGGHRVVGFDCDATAVQRVVEKRAAGADSLEKLISQLKSPRAVWLMVPLTEFGECCFGGTPASGAGGFLLAIHAAEGKRLIPEP